MYSNVEGVVQNYMKAHMWFNISASNGDDLGGNYKNIIAKQMSPSQKDEAQSLSRECVDTLILCSHSTIVRSFFYSNSHWFNL